MFMAIVYWLWNIAKVMLILSFLYLVFVFVLSVGLTLALGFLR